MRIISCVIKIKKCLLQIMPEWHRWSRSPGIRCCWTATTATAAGQDWFDRVARIIQCSVPCPCAPDIPVVNPAPPRVQMPPRHLPLRECVAGGGGGGGGGPPAPPPPPPQALTPRPRPGQPMDTPNRTPKAVRREREMPAHLESVRPRAREDVNRHRRAGGHVCGRPARGRCLLDAAMR
jgi:hypothetical protein